MNSVAPNEARASSPRPAGALWQAIAPYVAMARPDHWFKNVFALPGTALGILLGGAPLSSALGLLLGIPAMCLIASANYVINEWIDRDTDAHHPIKKGRPSVLGHVTLRWVALEYVTLVAIGLALSWVASPRFVAVSIAFLIQGILYNVPPMRTKDRPYVDVLSESINNPLRFLWGWFIVSSATLPSPSLTIGYWLAGAFLMALKRYAELRSIADRETAGLYRKSFCHYTETKLIILAMFCCIFASFLLGVFMAHHRIELILSFPFFSILFAEYLRLGMEPNSPVQAPEKLYQQKRLMAILAVTLVVVAILLLVDLPALELVVGCANVWL